MWKHTKMETSAQALLSEGHAQVSRSKPECEAEIREFTHTCAKVAIAGVNQNMKLKCENSSENSRRSGLIWTAGSRLRRAKCREPICKQEEGSAQQYGLVS